MLLSQLHRFGNLYHILDCMLVPAHICQVLVPSAICLCCTTYLFCHQRTIVYVGVKRMLVSQRALHVGVCLKHQIWRLVCGAKPVTKYTVWRARPGA